MRKNYYFILIFIFISVILTIGGLLLAQETINDRGVEIKRINEIAMKLQKLISQKRAEGMDVSKAIELDRGSREPGV